MRLDHLLSKESGRHGYRSNRCLVQGETESRLILFNFEGPEKGTQKSETLCEERGGVAQLGEHLLCKQGVIGSNPFISTIFLCEREDGEQKAKLSERRTARAGSPSIWAHSSAG